MLIARRHAFLWRAHRAGLLAGILMVSKRER